MLVHRKFYSSCPVFIFFRGSRRFDLMVMFVVSGGFFEGYLRRNVAKRSWPRNCAFLPGSGGAVFRTAVKGERNWTKWTSYVKDGKVDELTATGYVQNWIRVKSWETFQLFWPHWWEASTFATAPSSLAVKQNHCNIICTSYIVTHATVGEHTNWWARSIARNTDLIKLVAGFVSWIRLVKGRHGKTVRFEALKKQLKFCSRLWQAAISLLYPHIFQDMCSLCSFFFAVPFSGRLFTLHHSTPWGDGFRRVPRASVRFETGNHG